MTKRTVATSRDQTSLHYRSQHIVKGFTSMDGIPGRETNRQTNRILIEYTVMDQIQLTVLKDTLVTKTEIN